MEEVVLFNESSYISLVEKSRKIEQLAKIAKDCIDLRDCVEEAILSIDTYISDIRELLYNER